jgi:hypothetical protein
MPLALMKHREVLPLWQYHIDDKEPRTATHDSMGFPLFYCTRLRPLAEREATLVEINKRTAEMASHGWWNPDENVPWEQWKKQRFVWNTEDKFSLESQLAFCTDEPVFGADTTIRRFVTCADLMLRWTDKIYADFHLYDEVMLGLQPLPDVGSDKFQRPSDSRSYRYPYVWLNPTTLAVENDEQARAAQRALEMIQAGKGWEWRAMKKGRWGM